MYSKTKQEWFNGAWERAKDLRVCAWPAIDGAAMHCSYVPKEDGTPGCFIGAQVPEDVAEMLLGPIFTRHNLMLVGVSDMDICTATDFLTSLQSVHDRSAIVTAEYNKPENWHVRLRDLALHYGLTVPE